MTKKDFNFCSNTECVTGLIKDCFVFAGQIIRDNLALSTFFATMKKG